MEHRNPLLSPNGGGRFITIGEIMLRLTPPNYEKIRMASNFEASYGGAEANIAITLANLGVKDKTMVTLFNKQDRIAEKENLRDFKADYCLKISAKTGEGLEEMKSLLEKFLRERSILIERLYPYGQAGLIQLIRKHGQLLEEEYRPEGIYVKAYVPVEIYGTVAL